MHYVRYICNYHGVDIYLLINSYILVLSYNMGSISIIEFTRNSF